jgi:hypothetical protein
MRTILYLLLALVPLAGCFLFEDDESATPSVNVQGTWRAPVTFQSCSPTSTCDDAGFTAGTSANATMSLRQNGNKVEGGYTYDGAGAVAEISGEVMGNQVVLDGRASNPLGRITVRLTGAVSGSVIDARVSHEIDLPDGRSGSVSGTGNFTRM